MSVQDLVSLAGSGVPGLGAAVAALQLTYSSIENIKLYKQQCKDMSGRCVELMLSLRESSVGLEGHKAVGLADEITVIVERVNKRVVEWAALNRLRSFLQQREIKDGIDRLHRDIDGAMMKFNLQLNMELTRGQLETRAIQERDKAEIRELLENIIHSNEDMRTLLSMNSPQPVEDVMESLQTELRESTLEPDQEQSFRRGLWLLHQRTSRLPPLEDLTGQVTMSADRTHTVAKGSFNDIYLGEWLDNEAVALRLPRALANSPDVQKRFQREVGIWRSLQHDNIVPLYGIIYIGEDVYSVSPWMDNGTAMSHLQKNPDADRLRILTEAATGLEYLHLNGIVHGDLRGANVLIDKNEKARLSDFGLSKFLEDCGKGQTSSPGINPRWFAPEILRETGSFSTHSDVWSFAMLALEIMTGCQPYSDIPRDIAVLRLLDQGKIPDRPGRLVTQRGLGDELWSLMRNCWNKKPESRPSMTSIIAKLLEVRGMTPPSPTVKRRTSLFSPRRPSTADSAASIKSTSSKSRLGISFAARNPHRIPEEDDELSPISIQVTSGPLRSLSSPDSGLEANNLSKPSIWGLSANDRRFSNASSPAGSSQPSQVNSDISLLQVSPQWNSLPTSFGSNFPSHLTARTSSEHQTSPTMPSSPADSFSSGLLREAAADSNAILNLSPGGAVMSGTLEGLVERLISGSNLKADAEFRDVLLTTCADFANPEDLFGILARRFHEVEQDDELHMRSRVEIQLNIFAVTIYWVSGPHLQLESQLLARMKEFCMSALSVKQSPIMNDKAKDILRAIDNRFAENAQGAPLPLSPGRKLPKTSEMTPRDLAIGLTLLEGDLYNAILPTDYLVHLRRRPATNVDTASAMNNKIILWVKKSILHYDKLENRADVLRFFINTAQECRKLRNFASMSAIASALLSSPVERLSRTKEVLSQHMQLLMAELGDILDPASNHRSYRKSLNEVEGSADKDVCVPWIAVHLKELHVVLQRNPALVDRDRRPLINFERYVKFVDRLKEVLHYAPPDLERYRQQGQLAYLEHQLRDIQVSPAVEDGLMKRSRDLEAEETRDYRRRTRELKSLGFKTS